MTKKERKDTRVKAEIKQGGEALARAIAGSGPVTAERGSSQGAETRTAKVKVKTIHHHAEGEDRTGCGKWAADPALTLARDAKGVTCKACLASLNRKPRKAREAKPDVTILCSVCGERRTVKASQAHVVTRCASHQAEHVKKLRRKKAKDRKIRKHGDLEGQAMMLYSGILNTTTDSKILRALASYIYKITKA